MWSACPTALCASKPRPSSPGRSPICSKISPKRSAAEGCGRTSPATHGSELGHDLFARLEVTLAGYVVQLESNAIRVFEEQRVITRRPRTVFRCVHDVCAHLDQQTMDGVDVFARARAKAKMVQTSA